MENKSKCCERCLGASSFCMANSCLCHISAEEEKCYPEEYKCGGCMECTACEMWIKEKKGCLCDFPSGFCQIHPESQDFVPEKKEKGWEAEFDEKFKGWILQDDQEFYRGFGAVKSFISKVEQEAREAEREKQADLILGLQVAIEGMQKMIEALTSPNE